MEEKKDTDKKRARDRESIESRRLGRHRVKEKARDVMGEKEVKELKGAEKYKKSNETLEKRCSQSYRQ